MRAVVDVGSNSVLLLVADRADGAWRVLEDRSWVTGLGRDTKTTKLLSSEGMSDTLAALKEAFSIARSMGAKSIRAGATMAARIAQNTEQFLDLCQSQETPAFVLSGDEEARLGFKAIADDEVFKDQPRLTIIDPGGHSTELVTAEREGSGWRTLHHKSYPVGGLGIRETVWPSESPSFAERLNAVEMIDDVVGLRYLPGQCGTTACLGATGTNLVTIRDRILEWDPTLVHGQVLDFEEVSRAVGWMCDMTDAGRAAIPGLEKGREKTIHAGAIILERFMHAVAALEVTVSVRGWRHALLEEDPK